MWSYRTHFRSFIACTAVRIIGHRMTRTFFRTLYRVLSSLDFQLSINNAQLIFPVAHRDLFKRTLKRLAAYIDVGLPHT